MVNTIDMRDMRHLNLFRKITRISTRFCFSYNNSIIFCVPKKLVSRAVGESGRNAKQISSILGRRIKIIPLPSGITDIKSFIENIISPVTFKDLEVNEEEVIITAGSQSKAALIGRNRRREQEMQKIIKNFFGKQFKIA